MFLSYKFALKQYETILYRLKDLFFYIKIKNEFSEP